VSVDPSSQILCKVLDLAAARQRVLAHNLANLDTPGFTRSDLNFTEELAGAVRSGPQALANLSVEPTLDRSTPARYDGNNVQLETELAEMSKNALMYQMSVQALSNRFNIMRMAITGRSS
jgi:flagellar basal-body rod protein FlgB